MNVYLGENLKRLRQEKKLTQEAIANDLGVSFQTISKWENSTTYPDITMLPQLALYFGVSVDELLGLNKLKNKKEIEECIMLFDTMHYTKTHELIKKYRQAVKKYPNDYRLLVRYMELLVDEKTKQPFVKVADVDTQAVSESGTNNPHKYGLTENPEYKKLSTELAEIYEKIQKNCTNDSIRIWSKRIMFNHLMNKYELSFDEITGKWRCDKEAFEKAKEIISAMPALCDARECLEPRLAQDEDEFYSTTKRNIEELSYLLQSEIRSYCYYPYGNDFSAEYKIKIIESINNIFRLVDNKACISKNRVNLIYNHGHLGHLYCELGDFDNAIIHLKTSAVLAKELDSLPDEAERIMRFYEKEPRFVKMDMSKRMLELMTEHYPLPDEFKKRKEFREIIDLLCRETSNSE